MVDPIQGVPSFLSLSSFPPIVLQETQKQKKGQAVKKAKAKADKDTLSGPNLPRNLQLLGPQSNSSEGLGFNSCF